MLSNLNGRHVAAQTKRVATGLLLLLNLSSCSVAAAKTQDHSNSVNLGWQIPRSEIPESAITHWRRANQLLTTKSTNDIEAALKQVLSIAPHFNKARFTYIQWLVENGEMTMAAEQVRDLLQSDFPGYYSLLENSGTLKSLAKDKSLMVGIQTLRGAWEDALTTGWPTVYSPLSNQRKPNPSAEPSEYRDRRRVRAGVFLPQIKRFLPIGPLTDEVFALHGDKASQRLLYIYANATFDLESYLMNAAWQEVPWLPIEDAPQQEAVATDKYAMYAWLEAVFDSKGGSINKGETLDDFTQRLRSPSSNSHLLLLGEGAILSYYSPALSLDDNKIKVGKLPAFALPPDHVDNQQQSLLISGDKLYVVSNFYGCNYDNPDQPPKAYQRHVVDRFNLNDGTQQRVSQGNRVATIMPIDDKLMGLQRGEQLFVFKNESTQELQKQPSGLLLHLPLAYKHCVYQ